MYSEQLMAFHPCDLFLFLGHVQIFFEIERDRVHTQSAHDPHSRHNVKYAAQSHSEHYNQLKVQIVD